jgi:hypothetical protein
VLARRQSRCASANDSMHVSAVFIQSSMPVMLVENKPRDIPVICEILRVFPEASCADGNASHSTSINDHLLSNLYKKSKIGYFVRMLLPLGSAISRLQRLTVPTCLPLGAEALMPSR